MKITGCIFLLLLVMTSVAAQESLGFSLQVKAGWQRPRIYGAEKDSMSGYAKTGWILGLSALSPIGKSLVLKHDAWLAMQKGETRLDLFPVSAAYRKYDMEIFAGPYMGILLRADNYGNGSMENGYATKNDLGYTIGAGYTFRKRLNAEIRYVQGWSPLAENAGTKAQLKAYRQYLSFTLGYVLF
ncbi:outer membrane beta-barrel protein [Chitinophaga qingshengii]|uniref:Outer membrane beta-barrel protein n=1 Tax=Chitinophaga qingshengii TaxID=1569794 RepID=A0ABR7TXF7_9BACT|nr:outer membrane beta-barrel protein [Chitinophaga qingshengii]MBC9934106.1 outer membrane beta-barrel protein [Chitinophaga qingshengii]